MDFFTLNDIMEFLVLGSAQSPPEFTHFYVMTQQILNKAIMPFPLEELRTSWHVCLFHLSANAKLHCKTALKMYAIPVF